MVAICLTSKQVSDVGAERFAAALPQCGQLQRPELQIQRWNTGMAGSVGDPQTKWVWIRLEEIKPILRPVSYIFEETLVNVCQCILCTPADHKGSQRYLKVTGGDTLS